MQAADGAGAELSLEGAVLGGGSRLAYRIGPLLQRGQSALIHAASDEFGTPLVLKLYHAQPSQGEDPVVQWQREQQLMSRISHPHVLPLREALRIGGRCALVLERADTSLEQWILRRGPLADSQVRELGRQLLDGLHAIHTAGIVHLDLTPMNVLVQAAAGCPPGAVPHCRIGDFGIGVLLAEGVLLGRPSADWALLPPELLTPGQHQPTPRCDLYGLGLTLLFARRGSLPLANDLPHAVVAEQVLAGGLAQEAERLGSPLGQLLATLLQVDPERRPGSALDAWRLLQAIA